MAKTLGGRLAAERARLFLTDARAAQLLDVTLHELRQIETEPAVPRLGLLVRAEVAGMDSAYVFGARAEPHPGAASLNWTSAAAALATARALAEELGEGTLTCLETLEVARGTYLLRQYEDGPPCAFAAAARAPRCAGELEPA